MRHFDQRQSVHERTSCNLTFGEIFTLFTFIPYELHRRDLANENFYSPEKLVAEIIK